METVLTKGVSLRRAARLAQKRYGFMVKLVNDGHLRAFRDGGADDAPHLKVLPDEIPAAIERASVYVPDPPKRRQKFVLNPRVRC